MQTPEPQTTPVPHWDGLVWICISDRPVRWCVCAPDFENLCSRVFHLKEHGVNLSLKGFIQGLMWTLPLLSRNMILIFFLYPLGPRQELCNSSAPLYAVKSQVFIPGFMPGRQLHHLNIFLNSYVINYSALVPQIDTEARQWNCLCLFRWGNSEVFLDTHRRKGYMEFLTVVL